MKIKNPSDAKPKKSCGKCGQHFTYLCGLIFIIIAGFYLAGYPPLGSGISGSFACIGWLLKWVGFIAVINLFWIVMVYGR